jgi:hypothetical protein
MAMVLRVWRYTEVSLYNEEVRAMRMTTAQAWADAWSAGVAGSAGRMRTGAAGVAVAPGVTATQPDRMNRMRANWNAATVDGGVWQTNTAAVTVQQWRDAYTGRGIANAQTAAADPIIKRRVQNFATAAMPYYRQTMQTIAAMPKSTTQDSLNRVKAWMDAMTAAKIAGIFNVRGGG